MNLNRNQLEELQGLLREDPNLHLVVHCRSDHYPASHFRSALFFSLCASMALYFTPWDFYDPIWYLYCQIPALLFGYFAAVNIRLKRLFTTSGEMKEEVYQMALEVFHRIENLSFDTKLIYVSLLEKRIEIISLKTVELQEDKGKLKKLTRTISNHGLYHGLKEELPHFVKVLPTPQDATLESPLVPDNRHETEVPTQLDQS